MHAKATSEAIPLKVPAFEVAVQYAGIDPTIARFWNLGHKCKRKDVFNP